MYQYKAHICNIVDADTVDADIRLGFGIQVKLRLRVLDFDAPETFHPSCQAEREHGKEATNKAMEMLLDKKVVIHTKKKGKYGRYLAHIFIEGKDFAVEMREAGFQKKDTYD